MLSSLIATKAIDFTAMPFNQVYTSKQTSTSFARLTKIYTLLTPYHSFVAEINSQQGIPAQRPIFIEYPDDNVAYDIKFQYMYGPGEIA